MSLCVVCITRALSPMQGLSGMPPIRKGNLMVISYASRQQLKDIPLPFLQIINLESREKCFKRQLFCKCMISYLRSKSFSDQTRQIIHLVFHQSYRYWCYYQWHTCILLLINSLLNKSSYELGFKWSVCYEAADSVMTLCVVGYGRTRVQYKACQVTCPYRLVCQDIVLHECC